jgi:hypothetical protein
MVDSKTPFRILKSIVEEFMLVLLSSMYLLKRFDFFKLLMENLGIDVDKNPNQITELPVSLNFQANFWRLRALFMVRNLRDKKNKISDHNFKRIVKRLEIAEKFFVEDDSSWGLGLTYNLLARLYSD